MLEILDSANLEDCPLAVKFILQSITDDDCVEVIDWQMNLSRVLMFWICVSLSYLPVENCDAK